MKSLKSEIKEAVISTLVQGSSIRYAERMTGVHRDTVVSTLAEVGAACQKLMDSTMRNLPRKRVQVDEGWCYVGKKQCATTAADPASKLGGNWVFVGIDADTKLLPCYGLGPRRGQDNLAFIADLASRLSNRVEHSIDAHKAYFLAVEKVWGSNVGYGQLEKAYERGSSNSTGRYSAPYVLGAERYAIRGRHDPVHISTSRL